ncbi:hypothetical protein GE09DRAFT_1074246 [Coniochaeta sp. 2T2.1]|nr:hypothetical protein GE09DRAFT_1074246 [Coniochaeta sp. 2T2.1]
MVILVSSCRLIVQSLVGGLEAGPGACGGKKEIETTRLFSFTACLVRSALTNLEAMKHGGMLYQCHYTMSARQTVNQTCQAFAGLRYCGTGPFSSLDLGPEWTDLTLHKS